MRLDVDPLYCAKADLYNNPQYSEKLGEGYYYEKTIHKDVDIFQFIFENKEGRRTIVPVNCKPVNNVGSVAPGNDYDDPNPNRYPDDPSAAEIAAGWIKDVLDLLDTINGITILVSTITIVIVLLILMIVFWKQVGPVLQKSGKVVGKVGRGIGGFFKFIFEFIGDCCLLIHNIGANVLFFFFKIDLRVPKRLDFGFNSKTEPIKRREMHDKNMKSGSSQSSRGSNPDYSKGKKVPEKASAKDGAAQDKQVGRSASYGDPEEFLNQAIAAAEKDWNN